MKLKNTPTIEYLSESVFKNFVRFETDKVVLKDSCPKELAIIFYYIEPSDIRVVYEMSNPVCECGHKLDKHAIIKWEMDLTYSIFKYQYKCRTCGKTIITPLNDIVDKYSSYTNDTKNLVVNIYSNEHISYANATKLINEDQGLNISKQSIIIIWIKLMIIYWKRKKSLNKNLKKKILIYQDFQDMMKHFAE